MSSDQKEEVSHAYNEAGDSHLRTLGIGLLATYATGWLVMELSGILKPFVLGLFLSVLLGPVIDYLVQAKVYTLTCIHKLC